MQLDPALLERYALRLERKARAVRLGAIAVGALLGLALGAVPASPLGAHLPVPATFVFATVLAGGAIGALFGHVIGDGRALAIRVQAQLVLFHVEARRAPAARAEAEAPVFEPTELLPVRRAVLEAVPSALPARRLEVVSEPAPLLPPLSPTLGA
jgi:hypothetical protein